MEQEEICRTCLGTSSKFIPITNMTNYLGRTFTISKMIMACAPVEITVGDGLPSKICEICLKLTYVSFIFRIRILQADEKLKSHLQTKMIPSMQPVSEGFIEPLVLPSLWDDKNIRDVFSILHTTENVTDPLTVDPLNMANIVEQTDIEPEIETKIKSEILHKEEVKPEDDKINETTDNTSNFSLPTTTMPIININNIFKSSESLSNLNVLDHSKPIPCNLTNVLTDADISNLTEVDKKLIEKVLESLKSQQSDKNTKFIIVKSNQANSFLNDNVPQLQLESSFLNKNRASNNTQSMTETSTQNIVSPNISQNNSYSNSTFTSTNGSNKSVLKKQRISSKNKYLGTSNSTNFNANVSNKSVLITSQNMSRDNVSNKSVLSTSQDSTNSSASVSSDSNILQNMLCCTNTSAKKSNTSLLKKVEVNSFENELLKFVIAREKSFEQNNYFLPFRKDLNQNKNVNKKNARQITHDNRDGFEMSIDLTDDKSSSNDNTYYTNNYYIEENGSNKVMRLDIQEDESSIMID